MSTAPPHVTIVLNCLGTGGVERVALRLANGLAERGNRVSFVLLSRGGALEDRISTKVEVVRFGRSLERGAGLLRAAPRLAKLLRRDPPDVLLSPGNHMHGVVLLARRLSGVGGILALKMTNPVERAQVRPVRNRLRRALFRYAARHSNLLLMLSDAAAEEGRRIARAAASKVRVVANPYVEEALLDRASKRRKPGRNDAPLLLSVGRLTPQKDPLMMIEALAGVRSRRWRLVMLGEGPLADDCRKRAETLGIADRIDFPGFVPDASPWFEKARVFLLSSRYEELPAVLFEAMAARCPIVSTAASQSVVDALDGGKLGRLVPPGDVEAFRAAVSLALDSPALAPDAHAWLERFTIGAGVESHARALGLR